MLAEALKKVLDSRAGSFPAGNYLLFYLPLPGGIDLMRVLSGYMDIGSDDFAT